MGKNGLLAVLTVMVVAQSLVIYHLWMTNNETRAERPASKSLSKEKSPLVVPNAPREVATETPNKRHYASIEDVVKAMPGSVFPAKGDQWDDLLRQLAQAWFDENATGCTLEMLVRFRGAMLAEDKNAHRKVIRAFFGPVFPDDFSMNAKLYAVFVLKGCEWRCHNIGAFFSEDWAGKVSRLSGTQESKEDEGDLVRLRGTIKRIGIATSGSRPDRDRELPRAELTVELVDCTFREWTP